jgi:hypothetical protein
MTTKTPPVDWDRHAQLVARSIASIDRSRLPGSKTQFTAIIHDAIVDAMMMAAESDTPRAAVVAAVSQTSAPAEQGTAAKPEPGKLEAALAELDDMRDALAEFRKHRRDTYPHEAISILLSAFDDMLVISEAAVREAALCAESQTGTGRVSDRGGETRPIAPQTHAQQRPDVAGNVTCAACNPSMCDGRTFCGARLNPPAVRPFRTDSTGEVA